MRASLCILGLALLPACQSTSPQPRGGNPKALKETIDSEGFPIRVEYEDEGGDEATVTPAEVDERLRSHGEGRSHTASPPGAPTMIAAPTLDYDPFKDRHCPPEGNAKSADGRRQNRFKNRLTLPQPDDFDDKVTFAALRKPGYDL